MIELHDKFLTDEESDELVSYYLSNQDKIEQSYGGVYRFDAISLYRTFLYKKSTQTYIEENGVYDFKFSSKIKNTSIHSVRIQNVNSSININETTHCHNINWSAVVFLNDDYIGGELIVDNIKIKPKKNQCVIFSGNTPHMVEKMISGERYTLVMFLNSKLKVNRNLL